MFRIINIIMFAVFLLCIAVQVNDPDPGIWIVLYAVPAVFTLLAIRRKYSPLSAIAVVIYIGAFIYWVPRTTISSPMHLVTDLQMHEAGVEEAREAFGLLICAVWMAVIGIAWWRTRVSPMPEGKTTPPA